MRPVARSARSVMTPSGAVKAFISGVLRHLLRALHEVGPNGGGRLSALQLDVGVVVVATQMMRDQVEEKRRTRRHGRYRSCRLQER